MMSVDVLLAAVRADDVRAAERLLDADPSLVDAEGTRGEQMGQTALHVAAQCRRAEMVELLIRRGADVNAIDHDADSVLHHAAANSGAQLLAALIEAGARVNVKNNFRHTPLHAAVAAGDVGAVRVLVDNGAEVDAETVERRTSLSIAASKGLGEICSLLLSFGASACIADQEGFMPLHWAAREQRVDVVEILTTGSLITAVDSRAKGQVTPLHIAAARGSCDVCRVLIERGANIEATDADGKTALMHGSSCGSCAVVKLLLRHGANLEAQRSNGETSLSVAVRFGRLDVCALLLSIGATPRTQLTPLIVAALSKSSRVIELLLLHGARRHACSKRKTPLFIATGDAARQLLWLGDADAFCV